MKRSRKLSVLITAIMIVIAGAIIWEKIPLVRYYVLPLIGSTPAPKSFYGNQDPDKDKTGSDTGRILANRHHIVSSIKKVPPEGGWIDSRPLSLHKLEKHNKVILIDFWTYTCINCIRSNPFTQQLWQRYKNHGLVVIGVASPEFDIGGKPANVLAALKRHHWTYPVLMDANMKVWRTFGNHYWPGKYLLDPQGNIVFTQFGEGDYAQEEKAVRKQLKKAGYKLPDYGPPNPKHALIPANKPVTPELHAGPSFMRRSYGNRKKAPAKGKTITYDMPSELAKNRIYLGGQWQGHGQYVLSKKNARIGLNYRAQAAYIVLDPEQGPADVQVTLDGKPVPQKYRGKDISVKNGVTYMKLKAPRLYYPIANRAPYGRHTIRFRVPPDVRFYSFTFGAYKSPDKQ